WWCGEVVELSAHWDIASGRPERAVALRFASGCVGTLSGAPHNFRDDLLRVELYGTVARGLVAGLNGSYTRRSEEPGQPDVAWPRRDFGNDLFGPSFRDSVDAYCAALRAGRQPSASGDDALAELAIEAAIHRSASNGRSTEVPGQGR
ncbi:MAG: Gfo/Idh/MocA family oxidoreductase, partial [Chloroflexota bacterium]